MANKNSKVVYESKDDVLNIWLSKKPIDYAEDEDGVITHYTKSGEPVYIEILFASNLLKREQKKPHQTHSLVR